METKRMTREDQKELLVVALNNIKAALSLSRVGSEFALDGSIDNALDHLQTVVDNHSGEV